MMCQFIKKCHNGNIIASICRITSSITTRGTVGTGSLFTRIGLGIIRVVCPNFFIHICAFTICEIPSQNIQKWLKFFEILWRPTLRKLFESNGTPVFELHVQTDREMDMIATKTQGEVKKDTAHRKTFSYAIMLT